MCGRYTVTSKDAGELAERFAAKLTAKESVEDALGRYNVAPTQQVPAVVRADDGERELRLLRWGLVPSWAKDAKIGYRMINAKAETLAEKRTFAPLLRRPERRALLLADGWFEWLAPEAPKRPRQPMYFTVDGGEEAWLGAEAEDVLPLLRSLPSERLDVRPANPALNKVGGTREGPQLLTAPQTA